MIRLKLTVHAQGRLVERCIDIDHIKTAITNPDSTRTDSQGVKVTKKIRDKTIVVVYSGEKFCDRPEEFLVFTAYYLEN